MQTACFFFYIAAAIKVILNVTYTNTIWHTPCSTTRNVATTGLTPTLIYYLHCCQTLYNNIEQQLTPQQQPTSITSNHKKSTTSFVCRNLPHTYHHHYHHNNKTTTTNPQPQFETTITITNKIHQTTLLFYSSRQTAQRGWPSSASRCWTWPSPWPRVTLCTKTWPPSISSTSSSS